MLSTTPRIDGTERMQRVLTGIRRAIDESRKFAERQQKEFEEMEERHSEEREALYAKHIQELEDRQGSSGCTCVDDCIC